MFKRIWKWVDDYFSKEEITAIEKLKKYIDDLEQDVEELTEISKEKSEDIIKLGKEIEKFEAIVLILKKPKNRYKPNIIKEYSQSWLKQNINNNFNWITYVINDSRYITTTKKEFMKIVKEDQTNSLKYIKDTWDCENFASLFKSRVALYYGLNCVGVVMNYKGRHAFNIVVCSDGVLVLEPQSDRIWEAKENKTKGVRYQIDKSTVII